MNNQEILDNAPEGATHVEGDSAFKYDPKYNEWFLPFHNNGKWSIIPKDYPLSDCKDFRSLADIKRIAELEAQTQWISVAEEVPKVGQRYDGYHYSGRHTNCGAFSGAGWDEKRIRETMIIKGYSHWMPPPPPPSGGEL